MGYRCLTLTSLAITLGVMSTAIGTASWAASQSLFLPTGDRAFVFVQNMNRKTGAIDTDPNELYEMMNVPEKELSSGDRGKIIATRDQTLELNCVKRIATNAHQCQFNILLSPYSKLDPSQKRASYLRKDEDETYAWFDRFHLNREKSVEFTTSDGKLHFSLTQEALDVSFVEMN